MVNETHHELTDYCPHCWTKMDGEMNVGNDSQMVCSADITDRVCRLVQITDLRRQIPKSGWDDGDRYRVSRCRSMCFWMLY